MALVLNPIDPPTQPEAGSDKPPVKRKWPEPPAVEAFSGVTGELVRTLEPASEADPVALMVQFLAGFGSVIGRSTYFKVEGDRHYANEFFCLVGQTSRGRKGTSWGRIRPLFAALDPVWDDGHIQTGLSSGEGVVWAVRDPITKAERTKERGKSIRYEMVQADPGVKDKRLFVHEPEFANVLRQIERQGNTLSAVLRLAWDSGRLQTLTKNNAAKATDAHIALVGHITADELRRYLTTTEMANGFANRILWLCVRRSKELPEGGYVNNAALEGIAARLARAVAFAKRAGEIRRDEAAREIWREVYHELTADVPGLAGAMTARAEAHAVRLSLLYALLDCSPLVRDEHLLAALALVDYSRRSVEYVFGNSTGDGLAEEILSLLLAAPNGLSRNDITNLLGRHQPADKINQALALLAEKGWASCERVETDGRPREVWRALKM
jgi:hypothetical protein